MTNLLNVYRVKIKWLNKNPLEIFNRNGLFFCNLKFDEDDNLWSGILMPIESQTTNSLEEFSLSMMFPENYPKEISPGLIFIVLEGPEKLIGKGEVID